MIRNELTDGLLVWITDKDWDAHKPATVLDKIDDKFEVLSVPCDGHAYTKLFSSSDPLEALKFFIQFIEHL